MGRMSMRPLAAVCTAGTIAIGLAACGTGSSGGNGGSGGGDGIKSGPGVDVKTKTISLGVLSPLSGPVAAIGKPLTAGQETYFHAVNAAGGINGWKVKLVERDTKYDPQTQVQAFNRIAGNVAFIAQSLGSPTTKAIQPLADQQKMLIGAAAQDSSLVTDPVMAVIGTPYAIDNANALDHIAKQQGGANAKVGIIYQNDAYGQDGLRGYKAGLKAYHVNSVAEATYKSGDTDLTAQVQKMRSAGARYVFVVAVPSVASTIVGTGASQGYNPTWVFQGPAWSEYLMTSNGTPGGKPTAAAKALASNVWVLGYEAQWGDKSVPGMAKFMADAKRFAPSQIPDYYYMYGYAQAKMETAVLRKAIASGDLTRAGILDAKLHLGKVDLGGLVPTLDYTPALGPASRTSGISKVSSTTPGFLKGFTGFFTGEAAKSMDFKTAR
jgi:ABC-type branched-subunit amino acid transport system substrate-binding protein